MKMLNRQIVIVPAALIAFFLIKAPIVAQVNIAPALGFNSSTVDYSSESETFKSNFRSGMSIGIGFIFPINNHLGWKLAPKYLQSGAKFETTSSGNNLRTGASELRLNYINVPVLLNLDLKGNGNVIPYLSGGVGIGLLVSASNENGDIKDNFKSMDAGIQVGSGVKLLLGKNKWFIEIGYSLGLIDINNRQSEQVTPELKNRSLNIEAGFQISLGE